MTKQYLFIGYFLVFFCSCKTQKDRYVPKGYRYTIEFKDHLSDGTTEGSVANLDMIYFKNYIMYSVPSIPYILKKSIIKGDSVLNILVPSTDTVYTYYVIENKKKNGIKYNSLNSSKGDKFKLDSLLQRKNIGYSRLKIFSIDLGKPYKVDKKNGKISEVYLDSVKQGMVDTIYRFFDKDLNDLEFSFSKSLDKKMRSKLYKIKLVQLNTDTAKRQHFIKRTEVIDEVRRIKIRNAAEVLGLFKRFEMDSGDIDIAAGQKGL